MRDVRPFSGPAQKPRNQTLKRHSDQPRGSARPSRRAALGAIGTIPFFAASSLRAQVDRAQDDSTFQLRGEAGEPLRNFRIPSELDPASLPGSIWKGRRDGDVVVYEFFDYNCPYCRKAARELADVVTSDPNLRLGLINSAILSIGSTQAAKVQQAVLRLYGPAEAYNFHMKLYEARGAITGTTAMAVARAMGLDVRKVEESADSETVGQVVSRQAGLAEALGLAMTPSFIVAGTAILGWPGAETLRDIIKNARKCDQPVCDGKK